MATFPSIPIVAGGPPPDPAIAPVPGLAPQPMEIDGVTGLPIDYPDWYFTGAPPPDPAAPPPAVGMAPPPEQQRLQPQPFVDDLAGAPEPPMAWPTEQPAGSPPEVDAISGAGQPQATAPGRTMASPVGAGKNAPAAPPPKNTPRQSTGDPYLDAMYASGDARVAGIQAEADAQKAKNEYLSQEMRAANERAATEQAAIERDRMASKAEAKAKTEELNKEANEIANQKLNDRKVFDDMEMPTKIFLALGAALSGWSNPRGPNKVTEAVMAMVDRDMKTQAANLENRRAGLAMKRGLLSDEIAAGRDDIDARYKAMNVGLEMQRNAAIDYGMRFDNPVIDARVQQQVADIDEARATLAMQYQQAAEQRAYSRKMDQAQLGIQRGHLGLAQRKQAFDELMAMQPKEPSVRDQVQVSKEQREQQTWHDDRYLPGVKTKKGGEVLTLGKEEGEKYRKKIAVATSFVQKLDKIIALREKNRDEATGGWRPFGQWADDDVKAMNSLYEDVKNDYSTAKEQGVVMKADSERYDKMLGSVTGMVDPTTNLMTIRQSTIQTVNNDLQSQNRPGQEVAWWDPAPVPQGNDSTDVTPDDVDRKKRARAEQKRQNDAAPPLEWEVVGEQGDKWLTQGGMVIPRGRQIVDQYRRPGGGGRSVIVTELDDGTTYEEEE